MGTIIIPFPDITKHLEYFWVFNLWMAWVQALLTAQLIVNFTYWMNTNSLRIMKTFATTFLILSVVCLPLVTGLTYIVWVVILDYPYPMPYHFVPVGMATFWIGTLSMWIQFSSEQRKNKTFRRRFRFFIFAFVYSIFI